MNWIPDGRPAGSKPAGTVTVGQPAKLGRPTRDARVLGTAWTTFGFIVISYRIYSLIRVKDSLGHWSSILGDRMT